MSFPTYPKMKDSGVKWLGDVPEGWEVVQFKQYVDIQNGTDHKHVEQAEGYPVIGSGGVFAYASDYLFDGESVLLGRKGTIDKPLYVTGRFWTVDTMYWTKINSNMSGRFAYYLATAIPFGFYSTSTALPSMTKGTLSSHLVASPPLSEQTSIARFLDRETAKIDALIGEQRRLVELLQEKRQAVISHAVTKGLDPTAPMKPSGVEWLGNVPEHWEVRPLGSFCNKIGSGKTPAGGAEVYTTEGVLFLRSQNVYDEGLCLDDPTYIPDDVDEEMSSTRVLAGDVLLNITGASLGRTCLVPPSFGAANVNQHVCILRPREVRGGQFLSLAMKAWCVKSQIERDQTGSGREGLNFTQIARLQIAMPPVSEQRLIFNFVEEQTALIDELAAQGADAITLLQERRSALISAAVTGKIDVRGLVPADVEAEAA